MAEAPRIAAALRYQQEMDAAQRPATMNPNLAAQGATGRALVAPPTSVMDERYPAWKKSQDDAENLMNATEMIGAAIPLAGPAVKGAAALGRYAGPELARGLENYMVRSGGILPMDTWHGTPHRFPPTAKNPLGEFDPTKIGTGEGAQAYGAGAGYLAEAKGLAEGYRNTLAHKGALDLEYEAGKRGIPLNRESQVEFMRQAIPNVSPEKAARSFQNANIEARNLDQNKLAALFKDYKESKQGSLYKVDLPDEQIAKMLDWDKPLSQQSWYRPVADVVKEYKGAGKDVDAYAKLISKANARGGEVTGGQLYEGMLSQFGGSQAKVSEFMREAGIPGIRYLDQGSRAGGQGTSNFVVFDPAHMNIIGRE